MLTWLTAGLAFLGVSGGLGPELARAPGTAAAVPDVACAVSAPRGDGPLRTESFGRRQTVIAVRSGEVPDVIPDELDAYLKERGAVLGTRLAGGGVRVKAAWARDRRATGALNVTGKRMDRPGGRFRAEVSRVYGGRTFAKIVPSELRMSSTGCWRVRARAGDARVTYVVQVRLPHAGEL